MKFTIETKTLLSLMKALAATMPSRPVLPSLGMLKFEAIGDAELALTATDLDTWSTLDGEAEVEREGVALVPAKPVLAWLRKLKVARITIETVGTADDLAVKFTAGQGEIQINAWSDDDFPKRTLGEMDVLGSVPQTAIRRWQALVGDYASTEESRPILMNVALRKRGSTGTVVATNGHRLGEIDIEQFGLKLPDDGEILISSRALKLLAGLLTGKGMVELSASESAVIFSFANGSLATARQVGPYPDVEHVRPNADQFAEVTIPAQTLAEIVGELMPFASSQTHQSRMHVSGNQGLAMSAETPDLGSATQRRDGRSGIRVQTPADFTASFNLKYLAGLAKRAKGDSLVLKFQMNVAGEVLVDRAIEVLTFDQPDFYQLLMPMRDFREYR